MLKYSAEAEIILMNGGDPYAVSYTHLGLAGSHIPKQQQAGVVSVCLLPVLHIGAGLVHQGILESYR